MSPALPIGDLAAFACGAALFGGDDGSSERYQGATVRHQTDMNIVTDTNIANRNYRFVAGVVLTQIELKLVADDPEDADTLFRLTHDLRELLLAHDVEDVEFVRSASSAHSKAALGELVAGALLVTTTLRGGGLRVLVDGLQSFLRRRDGNRIRMRVGDREMTVDGAAARDISAAVTAFLHAVEPDAAEDAEQ